MAICQNSVVNHVYIYLFKSLGITGMLETVIKNINAAVPAKVSRVLRSWKGA